MQGGSDASAEAEERGGGSGAFAEFNNELFKLLGAVNGLDSLRGGQAAGDGVEDMAEPGSCHGGHRGAPRGLHGIAIVSVWLLVP
mmetsp:Transcript_82450/g.137922  ORF Transcript_82450/g.137922 Transcript_82450/m.137922 type:complete len:85 (+) Transcript_82450:1782-2036(+)